MSGVVLVTDGDTVVQLTSASDEELRLLSDVVRSLPPVAVNDLLSTGVCIQCVLRLFGLYGPSYTHTSALLSILPGLDNNLKTSAKQSVNGDFNVGSDPGPSPSGVSSNQADICHICCGMLQFMYVDDKGKMIKCHCAYDLAVTINEFVKKEGHEPDGFTLEVSLPPVIVENDDAMRLKMKRKYGSETWFQESLQSSIISVKDALKLAITSPLESLLGVKGASSSFRIRLTYSHPDAIMKSDTDMEKNQSCKRRKTGADMEHSDPSTGERSQIQRCNSSADQRFSGSKLLQEKASACVLTLNCYRTSVYIGGRYLKYSRNVSQTRWIIDDERKGEASVEEILGGSIVPLFHGDNYKFHAAGREDIDVRMLGSGRPFLVEIQNARVIPSEVLVKELERKINSSSKLVGVKNLRNADSQVWNLMREGEAEKQKQYSALVWISRQLEDKDLETLSSLKDMTIVQRTPIRVLHRRSPLEREKIIHWMKVDKIAGSSQYFLLHLCTQAGTYIKEFVHGDLGRTNPSIGSILGCTAEILQLDVTDVKMDCFLADGSNGSASEEYLSSSKLADIFGLVA